MVRVSGILSDVWSVCLVSSMRCGLCVLYPQYHNRKTDSIQLMINIISVFVLFGLTWIFGALTIMKAAQIFQIVFTILNSFQGFLIFILFCVLKKEIRSSWADILIKWGVIRFKKSGPIQQSTKMSLIPRPSVTSNIGKDETTFTEEIKH